MQWRKLVVSAEESIQISYYKAVYLKLMLLTNVIPNKFKK